MFMIEKEFDPYILTPYFSNKVRLACTFCKRYGTKATCPPNIEPIAYYAKTLPTYTKGILLIHKFSVQCENAEPCSAGGPDYKKLSIETTQRLNTHVISYRYKLLQEGHPLTMAFGAGSCKICEKCAFPCRHPDKSLIPIEGTGIDVVKLVWDLTNTVITFPVVNTFYRVGAVFFDD